MHISFQVLEIIKNSSSLKNNTTIQDYILENKATTALVHNAIHTLSVTTFNLKSAHKSMKSAAVYVGSELFDYAAIDKQIKSIDSKIVSLFSEKRYLFEIECLLESEDSNKLLADLYNELKEKRANRW